MNLKHLKQDLPAALVVFLVALPLCLGIAGASDAPAFSGIIAGIVGGIVVGLLSGSNLSVSGPAAGLTVIVATAIADLEHFNIFLLAVVLAGAIQVLLGFLRAGIIGYYFPNGVIKGMLAAIGLILILKEIPHALGWDKDFVGDFSFFQKDSENTFSEIAQAIAHMEPGAVLISSISLALILLFDSKKIKSLPVLRFIPGALVAVIAGVAINQVFKAVAPGLYMSGEHVVVLPAISGLSEISTLLTMPDWTAFGNPNMWRAAVTIALIASIESLLSTEATDKLDPQRRVTPANRELKAQGIGNMVSGLIGGIPVTAVIVRSSANIMAGAQTKVSAVVHGILLAVLVLALPDLLNLVPMASLAAVLFAVGYKLTKPSLYVEKYRKGSTQFVPFIATVLAILFTDLLVGIGIGMLVGIFYVIKSNFTRSTFVKHKDNVYTIHCVDKVTFLNKATLTKQLLAIPTNSEVVVDLSKATFIDLDIQDSLADFSSTAQDRGMQVRFIGDEQFNFTKA
jgi:MFS superfamily sulfate permease-like transporter